jgi:predicted NBD/HSP70 family sugar kinase
VAGLVNLVNPEVIVLGGLLTRVGDVINGPMLASLERCAIPSAAASVSLREAQLDTDADVVGALAVAEERYAAAEGLIAAAV